MRICAYFEPGTGAECEAIVRRALRGADCVDGPGDPVATVHAEPTVLGFPGGAIGYRPSADRHAPFALTLGGAGGNQLVVSGAPVALGSAPQRVLQRAAEADAGGAAAALKELDGGFAALHWDAAARCVTVVTDFLGLQPLYLARSGQGVAFTTDLKSMVATGLVDPEPDPAAWGAFYTFGHSLGGRTFLAGVRRVAAGAVLTYDGCSGELRESGYWRWPEPAPELPLQRAGADDIAEALTRSVRAYGAYGHDGVVLLSGGFDSRLVLCTIQAAQMRPRALIVAHDDQDFDADGRFAVRVARELGVPFELAHPAPSFYGDPAYERYLQLSESANPSLGLFIARVSAFVRPDMAAVWDGLAPQALRRLNNHAARFETFLQKPRARAERWLAGPASRVFVPHWVQAMREGLAALLVEESGRYPDDEFGIAEFSTRNRTRLRIGNNPFQVYGADVLPFTPGLTREYYELVGRLSGATKGTDALVREIFRRRFPRALRIPVCSGSRLVPRPGLDLAFLLDRSRSRLLRNYYLRRALVRAGVLRSRAFDVDTPRLRALAETSREDPRLLPDLTAAPRDPGRAHKALGADALDMVFYWQSVRRVVAGTR